MEALVTQTHVHQYVRKGKRQARTRSGDVMYICTAPTCYHTLGKSHLLGKMSICNGCGNAFQLTLEDLKSAKPRCLMCRNTKVARQYQAVQAIASGVFDNRLGDSPFDHFKERSTYANEGNDDNSQEDLETDDPFI
jgi:hypothetical protein